MKRRVAVAVIVGVLIAAALVSLLAIFTEASLTYPIRVSFHFTYAGKPVETSYLTTVHKELGNFIEISLFRYTHSRGRKSFPLPDGSLVLLSPVWPQEWESFEEGKSYPSAARWFWQDSSQRPTQIVYGDGGARHLLKRSAPAPFPWLDVTATVERLDQSHLREALRADAVRDDQDKLEYSNLFGGTSKFHGTVFISLDILDVLPFVSARTEIEQLKNSSGWIAASGGCRFKPVQRGDPEYSELVPSAHDAWKSGLTKYAYRATLLREGTGWSGDDGPRVGEPVVMYSTGKHVDTITGQDELAGSSSIAAFGSSAIQMVHAVQWDGLACTGIEPPQGSQNLLLQFSDGRLSLITPSDAFAVLGQ